MVISLQEIPITAIKPNLSQPREHFDKEKIKELAESILSNGLINPITVRKDGTKFIIVTGERRYQAHHVAKLKNVQAFVKEYKDDGQWMVESLIENVHREDLGNFEKARYLNQIKDELKVNNKELSIKVKMGERTIKSLLSILPIESEVNKGTHAYHDYDTLSNIASIEDKELRKKLLDKSSQTENFRQVVRITKKAPEEIRNALLDDKITVEQAQDLSKIHSDKARAQSLKEVIEHKRKSEIIPKLKENSKPELTDALKNKMSSFQKKIFQLLYDGKSSMNKSVSTLKNANILIDGLIERQFEYALDKRTLKSTIQQMKTISDLLSQLDIQKNRFDELKEVFIERIEKKL